MAKMSLNEQAKEIMKIAEESGVQSNFFLLNNMSKMMYRSTDISTTGFPPPTLQTRT